LEANGTTERIMKQSKLVEWVRTVLNYPNGGDTEMTFEYEDEFVPDRQRYYCLTDLEYLLIQLALSGIALNYGSTKVGHIYLSEEEKHVIGDDYIELLSLLHVMRSGDGDTFVKPDKLLHEVMKAVQKAKKEEELPKCRFSKKEKVAEYYWKAAMDRVVAGLREMRKEAREKL